MPTPFQRVACIVLESLQRLTNPNFEIVPGLWYRLLPCPEH